MNSSLLLGITTFAYLFASLLYVAIFVFKTEKPGKIATLITIVTLLLQTVGIGLRWIESYSMSIGHAPLTNMYESVVFFSWSIIILYCLIEWRYKTRLFGAFVVPLSFLAMAYASFTKDINKAISPLVPALQSNWLIAHVVTCFVGYAAFAISAGTGLMYLLKSHKSSKASQHGSIVLPDTDTLEDLTHKTMIFGFIWLSMGIITGAIWANSAWGTYWSWDPKETWSLITWFVYAITLHARYTRGWDGKKIAWFAILGFLAVLFTYYGVNFLLSGLHSYGSN